MMDRRKWLGSLFLLGLAVLFSNCGTPRKELIVSAAASLKESFEEIAKAFEKEHKGVKVLFNFGGSGQLRVQIEGGAVVDVFASAGQKDMDLLEQKGLLMEGTRRNFVENEVVLIIPAKSTVKIKDFADLSRTDVKHIAIGDPKLAPVGKYSLEILHNLNLWDKIKGKIVYAGDVRGVLDYVARNEVEAGLVYRTDALARPKEVKVVVEAPKGSYTKPLYPIAVLKKARDPSLGEEFISFIISPQGQKVLKKHGFTTPSAGGRGE